MNKQHSLKIISFLTIIFNQISSTKNLAIPNYFLISFIDYSLMLKGKLFLVSIILN